MGRFKVVREHQTMKEGLSPCNVDEILLHHRRNFRGKLTGENINEEMFDLMYKKHIPRPDLFSSTGARNLKRWLKQYTNTDPSDLKRSD